MGVELKNNIKKYWWDSMVLLHENLSCTHACLHGTIIGDAYVKEELTLKANCVMQGNIYTTKLEIESQAKFNGSVVNLLLTLSSIPFFELNIMSVLL